MEKDGMVVLYRNKEDCCGCAACCAACPKGLIKMVSDEEGFDYPVIAAPESCVGCRACLKVCPMKEGGMSQEILPQGGEKGTVGIVTINDYINYGNRLQNYALTRLLQAQGFRVINGIRVYTKQDYLNNTKNRLKRSLKRALPFSVLKKRIGPKKRNRSELQKVREQRFIAFSRRYSEILDPIIVRTHGDALKLLGQHGIDFYVSGSDQIWNPEFAGTDFQFLAFAPKEKRLSFAASIGVDRIPAGKVERYRKRLSEMKYLSVREQRAVEIVRELTGREADLTPDPTLLLGAAEWEHVIRKPLHAPEQPYICTYFLGEVPDAVRRFAEATGLPIHALNSREETDLYTLDPGEFLYMIRNAAYVLTDSFHGTVFSAKFHREFYVFERVQAGKMSMFSRIETVTKKLRLENRIQDRAGIVPQAQITHWDEIDALLEADRADSMKKILVAAQID